MFDCNLTGKKTKRKLEYGISLVSRTTLNKKTKLEQIGIRRYPWFLQHFDLYSVISECEKGCILLVLEDFACKKYIVEKFWSYHCYFFYFVDVTSIFTTFLQVTSSALQRTKHTSFCQQKSTLLVSNSIFFKN